MYEGLFASGQNVNRICQHISKWTYK